MFVRHAICAGVLLLLLDCYQVSGQEWNEWNAWTNCSAPCGTGHTSRTRTCKENFCTGHDSETGVCHHSEKCMWGTWGPYGSCSTTCGPGVLVRTRPCNNGNITTNMCEGSHNSTIPCDTGVPCPTWSTWGEWAACPATCGVNVTRLRGRSCVGIGVCTGNSTMSAPCDPIPPTCPGQWTQWIPLTCSTTCGPGTRLRTRTCPTPPGGCVGISQDAVPCNPGLCEKPVDSWAEWGEWTSCSVTCGRGKRSRTRSCLGTHCIGRARQNRRCRGARRRCGGRRRRCRTRRCRNRARLSS